MAEQKILMNRLFQLQQQKSIIEKQETELKKQLIETLKKAGANTAEGNALFCKIESIAKEVYAKNAFEVIPAEKMANAIYEKILQGQISMEKLIDLFAENEQQVIKKGLQNCGAMKKVSTETLIVSPKQ